MSKRGRTKNPAFDKHCINVTHDEKKSNSHHWTCKYCGKQYTSGATRLLAHLSKLGGQVAPCKEIPQAIADEIAFEMRSGSRGAASAPAPTPPPPSAYAYEEGSNIGTSSAAASTMSGSGSGKRPRAESEELHGRQPTLSQVTGSKRDTVSFLRERQRLADIEIARTIIDCNLAFHVLKNEQWKKMVRAIANVGPCEGWTGVSYGDMRTKKIDEEKERIDRALDPIRAAWAKYGCSILADGWSDRKKRGIINILVSCPLGTYFLRAVDTGKKGAKTTGSFIFRHIRHAIIEVGAHNVVQVITDNASNCRRMGRLLEAEFPTIVWTPCASHCLDLFMEDVGKLKWVAKVTEKAKSIVTFFTQKVKVLAMFREHSKLELKKPSSTRFAYMWIVLERLYEVRTFLRQTVVSTPWNEWEEHESQEAKAMQRRCLDDGFWSRVRAIVIAMTPFYRVLRMTDCEGSTMGLLVHFYRAAVAELDACDAVTDLERREILQLADKRWKWMRRPIHGFAALVHPAYKSPAVCTDIALRQDRDAYMRRVLPIEEHNSFLEELGCYADQRGQETFASPICWMRQSLVKPLFWWDNFGYGLTHLQPLAMRILAQDCSSGACERNWSTYSLIHTKIRNRLSTRQLERLVYCRANMRMMRSMLNMGSPKQVNVDTFKLTGDNLESVHKEVDEDEELLFAELYRELMEADIRNTRQHGRGVPVGRGKGLLVRGLSTSTRGGTATYVRRGSTSSNPSLGDGLVTPREPSFDDEGNLLSEEEAHSTPSIGEESPSISDEDSDTFALEEPLVPSPSDSESDTSY